VWVEEWLVTYLGVRWDKDDDRQEYLLKILKKIRKLPLVEWDNLPEECQIWYDEGARLYNHGVKIIEPDSEFVIEEADTKLKIPGFVTRRMERKAEEFEGKKPRKVWKRDDSRSKNKKRRDFL